MRSPTRTRTRPPSTNAMREQSPDTATCVTPPLAAETRSSAPPGPRETNASATPLVSSGTRLLADETKATHEG